MKQRFYIYDRETGELLASGSAQECAKKIGYVDRHIYRLGKCGGSKVYRVEVDRTEPRKPISPDPTIFTVYDKNDNVVCVGTRYECAEQLGFTNVKSFNSVLSKTRAGIVHKWTFVTGLPEEV